MVPGCSFNLVLLPVAEHSDWLKLLHDVGIMLI